MNLERIRYTLNHRKAFREVEKELFGKVSFKGLIHDLDKVFLYLFLDVKKAHNLHQNYSRHHKKAHSYKDYCSMVVDWECARRTKPDKPLNAYETLYKFHPELEDKILPILQDLGLDHPREES